MKRKIFSVLFAVVLVCSFSLMAAVPVAAGGLVTNTTTGVTFETIQAAIDAAADGDIINVAAGIYTEDLAIDGKNLTLVGAGSGADPVSNTILYGVDDSYTNYYTVTVTGAASLEVSGFRFIGNGNQFGIYAYDSSTSITANIHDNVFAFFNQSGVRVGYGLSGSLVQNNEFIGCGGVEFWNSTGGTISGNSISDSGVGTFLMGCDGTTVSGNEVTVFGRGLRINSPAGISGDYSAGYALFGPLSWTDITGEVVYAEPPDGSSAITNDVNGKIALIDRGSCTFAIKVKNAQDAGAIGVIIANNQAGMINLAGADASITIPAISVKLSDGDAIKAELATGVNATLSSTPYGAVIADEGIHIQSCNNITVTGNTVSNFTAGEYTAYTHGRKGAGIWISGGCDALTIENNNLKSNSVGVYIGTSSGSSSPTNVKINKNNIEDNAHYGVLNIKYPESGSWNEWDYHLFGAADAPVDATYNWWGDETGPSHATLNPGAQGDAVSDKVNFSPWLYKTQENFVSDAPCYAGSVVLGNEATEVGEGETLSWKGGWNSFSTPVTLDDSADSVSELLALTADSGLFIVRAQRFDPSTQKWVDLVMGGDLTGDDDYQIKPGEGFFIQVKTEGSLPILCLTTPMISPPMTNLVAGWNLVGLSSFTGMTVESALHKVDYSVVISPSPNAVLWSVPSPDEKSMQLVEAYWLAMPQPGILFGHTTTPVADNMAWELNQ